MNQKLTRRRFTQLAIASTTAVAIAALPRKTTAQTNSLLYGVGVRAKGLILQTFDVASQIITDRNDLTGGVTLNGNEQLTAFTTLANGTPVVALTSIKLNSTGSYPIRLIFLGSSPVILNLSELGQQFVLNSIVGTNDGGLFILINKLNGQPPFKVGTVDLQTGQVNLLAELNLGGERVGNITQCEDGKILGVGVDQTGSLNLVQLDQNQNKLGQQQQLRFSSNDGPRSLNSLACSPSGQLFALSSRRYEAINSLFTIDTGSGIISPLLPFPVSKITFARTVSVARAYDVQQKHPASTLARHAHHK